VKAIFPAKLPLRELTEQALLKQLAPDGALVNQKGDILYLHGHTGQYLELPAGEPAGYNILKLAREGLRQELTTILHQAAGTKEIVHRPGLRVKIKDSTTLLNLTICPLAMPDASLYDGSNMLYLVILAEAPSKPGGSDEALDSSAQPSDDAGLAALRQELRGKEEYLQAANEELETANEELKSSNEEMQSVNEELQSTNEELETSKEELQSVNEELSTVNAELQNNVADLSRLTNDTNNLLAGSGIATVFVDHQLRILRFTPSATKIINLILSDVGRPVSHIVSNLAGFDRLTAEVQSVLDTLIPREVEVQTTAGEWYTMRIQPYRTLDNVIEGAVLTFVEISEMIHMREALRKANDLLRLAVVVRDSHDAISVQDLEGRILAWNPGAERIYGWSEAEALKLNIRDLIPESKRQEALGVVKRLGRADILEPYRMQRIAKDGRIVDVWLTATALVNEAGQVYAIATTERERGLETGEPGSKEGAGL
jgi:two-component system CheB/CheR fusion protein